MIWNELMYILTLEIYQNGFMLILTGMLYFLAVYFLTPNPKRHTFFRWIGAEMLEHLLFPLVIFILILIPLPIPAGTLFFIMLPFLILLLYGKILGRMEMRMDGLKIILLYVSFLAIMSLPDLMMRF